MQKKNLIDKYIFELNGKIFMFSYDNLLFKTTNMPKKQCFNNICKNFKLKKLIKGINLFLPIIYIDS